MKTEKKSSLTSNSVSNKWPRVADFSSATSVSFHSLCYCYHTVKVKVAVVSSSLQPHGLYSPRSSPGQNTGVGSRSLLQGIFPTQGSNPSLLHCRQILYQLSHKGSPRILEWVAYPLSSGSSWPRSRTGVSCTVGRFLTNWAIREATTWGPLLLCPRIRGSAFLKQQLCYIIFLWINLPSLPWTLKMKFRLLGMAFRALFSLVSSILLLYTLVQPNSFTYHPLKVVSVFLRSLWSWKSSFLLDRPSTLTSLPHSWTLYFSFSNYEGIFIH